MRVQTKLFFAGVPLLLIALLGLARAAETGQQTFTTPEAATQALRVACEKNDNAALLAIFGPEGKDIVESGDADQDQEGRAIFARLVRKKTHFIVDPMNPDKTILAIGSDDWPFPAPLMREKGAWHFDAGQGRQEILARRIGSNELDAIEVCRSFVTAQFEYAHAHGANGLPVYAQKIVSTPGLQDGLYWETKKGEPPCDIPRGFARAAAGMKDGPADPYHGYYFKVLTAQGADARGGAMNYRVKDAMIGGFALAAWPAQYGVSGVQTFVVNHDGIVYEKHLGPETATAAAAITEFNPDKTWQPIR